MSKLTGLQQLLLKAEGTQAPSHQDVIRYTLAGYFLGSWNESSKPDGAPDELPVLDPKVEHWKAIDKTATAWEPKFSKGAVAAFEEDERYCLGVVNDVKQKALSHKQSIDWASALTDIAHYLETEGGDQWRSKFTPLIEGVMTSQGKRWAVLLGMEFDVRNFFAEDWFTEYTLKFAQPINETTLEGLSTVFQQAQAEGWSVSDMQKRITTLFKQWSKGDVPKEEFEWYAQRMPPYRTEMIARTETMRSSNAGSQQLFQEWNVQKHEWLSTQDGRTRDAHLGVNIDPKVVPIDEPFLVGGEYLMYPGDPVGSAKNTINCRCTVLPVMEGA